MKRYDDIVVGSGISGLTMSLILAHHGRKVLLLEKNPRIGGSLARFYREGIPFDTGFHFTAGFESGGMLDDILTVLGIRDSIKPLFLSEDNAVNYFIESEGRSYVFPTGIERTRNKFKDYFPAETCAIDGYFDRVRNVCDNTPSMRLGSLGSSHNYLDEDFVTLDEMLNGLTGDDSLKAMLSGLVLCYGVRPGEISFANHSRMCFGLYKSVARVNEGGDAFIKAFTEELKKYEVEIRCKSHIVELADINGKEVRRYVLNTGEEVAADNCVFTIHPKEILKIIPDGYLKKAFKDRVSSYESSAGFFSVFAAMDDDMKEPDFDRNIVSLLPDADPGKLLAPDSAGDSALCLIKTVEQVGGTRKQVINVFEPSFMGDVEAWKDSTTGHRPQGYRDYKNRKTDGIMERIFKVFPAYKSRLKVLDTASVLTFRDYLNNGDGSAYGIKQKIGQHNLLGRLPLRNLYAAGQSSLLPGILGAMMSSFMVGRYLIDEGPYRKYLRKCECS